MVTVANGGNANSIAEFDQTGTFLGSFIGVGSGGLDSPFDLIFRDNDVLVVSIDTDNVIRYDLDGTFLDIFAGGIPFGEQIFEMANSDVAVANFSGTNGVSVYDASGSLLRNLAGVTGLRGVYELPSGNVMVTNGGGVYEVNGQTGALVRQMVIGVSARFITLYSPTPDGPALAVSPNALDFGDVDFGDTATDTVYAISFGSDTLQLDSTVSTYPMAFTISAGNATLPSGDSLLIHTNFTPDSVGSFAEYLVFYHNGPSSPDSLAILGNGVGQPALTLTPTDLNMGMVNGGDTLTAIVNAASTGNATLTIDSIRIDNPLFSSNMAGVLIMAPSSATDIQVTFVADTTQSLQNGNMVFYSDNATSPDSVLLTADVITAITSGNTVKPDKFYLAQNFPNPFNPTTTITYLLPQKSSVQLDIFNTLGQIVKTHYSASQQPGEHKFQWDGTDATGNFVPSGIYFYRLKADQGFEQVRKMMLIK